jgi:hypothetical protein
MLSGVQKSVREWTLTLLRELPLWELEFRWTPEFLESDCKGQKSLNWGIIYIIGKLLEPRCLKWACMTHLDTWNTSYAQKKGRKSNWQFDFRPLKVRNRLESLMWRWRDTYHWKAFDNGYNFSLDFISIECLKRKLWAFKVVGGQSWEFRDSHLGVAGQKCHLDVVIVERHIIYYKGEGGGFPPSPGDGEYYESEFVRGSS